MKNLPVEVILNELDNLFPEAKCELDHKNEYEMAIAVILSAQTTDASVNKVTPNLFKKFPTLDSLAKANIKDIEKLIASLGLFHNKAKAIKGFASGVVKEYDGIIPNTMKDLVSLPGVGRKCANVILSECFNIPALAVDTHVNRVSKRLGLAYKKDSLEKVEEKLKRKIPKERWIKTHHQLIFFGRYLCHAQNPECEKCPFLLGCHEKKRKISTNNRIDLK